MTELLCLSATVCSRFGNVHAILYEEDDTVVESRLRAFLLLLLLPRVQS